VRPTSIRKIVEVLSAMQKNPVGVRAISDFHGVSFPGFKELSFSLGTSFFMLEIDEKAGWAKGGLGDVIGWFPISFVEPVDNDNTVKECISSNLELFLLFSNVM
jgi:hypothetical protein